MHGDIDVLLNGNPGSRSEAIHPLAETRIPRHVAKCKPELMTRYLASAAYHRNILKRKTIVLHNIEYSI
jgi:hypothetical protein